MKSFALGTEAENI